MSLVFSLQKCCSKKYILGYSNTANSAESLNNNIFRNNNTDNGINAMSNSITGSHDIADGADDIY